MKTKSRVWRFLDTGYRTAAENMALDDVILESVSKDMSPNTIRLLRFRPPAVLVGYHQDVEHEVRLEYVKEKNIDVNRRITGGGAIYFDETSIGWEIIAKKGDLPTYRNFTALFETMCKGIINALRRFGISASFRPKNDVEIDGRKISGTGGTEKDDAILFQGTLLVDFDVETMIKALRIPTIKLKDKELKSVKDRITCMKWELGYVPTYDEIKMAIKRGFEEEFNIKLMDNGLTQYEYKLFKEKLPYFQSKDWIYLDRRFKDPTFVSAVTKKPGGVIRVSIAVDTEYNVIKSILITGDFFVSPKRTIYDLEARLKFIRCDKEEIKKIIYEFFDEYKPEIPGITPNDIYELIIEALEKISYKELGFDDEEVNHIYPITKSAQRIFDGYCEYLLLPYCAKYINCEYRKIDGCIKCGLCTIGEAYELAEKAGLKAITIQNFEHLMEVLNNMMREGAKGFIGCCCEAFYQKHRDDMESFGIPGIIIDIEDKTCYELGRQLEAYKGDFEVQTRLKIDVLSKLINQIKRKYLKNNLITD